MADKSERRETIVILMLLVWILAFGWVASAESAFAWSHPYMTDTERAIYFWDHPWRVLTFEEAGLG